MAHIDKKAPVMISGATGYVAGWIVKKLLDEGHTVHAPVRNPGNKDKLKPLQTLADNSEGAIVFFQADLMDAGSYDEAMQGCELVFHTASPFIVHPEDAMRDLVIPATQGTRNVLSSASAVKTVKRVVDTSSCAAVYGDCVDIKDAANGKGILTEADWNTSSAIDHNPYYYSKTLAEQLAWDLAKDQHQWDLVVMNPSFVIGPAIDPQASSDSFEQIIQLADGTTKQGAPEMGTGIIDVRDLAQAHYQAGFTPEASGRYIISGHNSDMVELAKILHKQYGDQYPIPNKAAPKWLLWLLAPFIPGDSLTRKFVAKNIGIPWRADNSKSVKELGMKYTDLESTVVDMFEQIIAAGRI